MSKEEIDIFQSALVAKHEVLNEDEKIILLKNLHVLEKQFPKIKSSDPAVKAVGAKKGDLIKITRVSEIAGTSIYYRVVVN